MHDTRNFDLASGPHHETHPVLVDGGEGGLSAEISPWLVPCCDGTLPADAERTEREYAGPALTRLPRRSPSRFAENAPSLNEEGPP